MTSSLRDIDMTDRLDELCRLHGILAPPDPQGRWSAMLSEKTQKAVLAALGIDPHARGTLEEAQALEPPNLAIPGKTCFTPDWLEEERCWGIAVQLYELRSERNWGIGDLADLARLVLIAAEAGADFIGLNPLHALFGADPERASPFSPSNRRFLNPLYIAVDQVDGFDTGLVRQSRIEMLRASECVDYVGVAALKYETLKTIWEAGWRDSRFDAFIEEGGEALRLHCLFETISAHMVSVGHGAGWHDWPDAFQDRTSDHVADFAEANAAKVRFHQWLQYLCEQQLRAAQELARACGMRIGLYLDLAIGEAPDGSASWSDRARFLAGAEVGAPPDMFSAGGQQWGLTTITPLHTRRSKGETLRPIYAAAMRHAGAMRLDHAMGIWQLFLIPDGFDAADGAYVRLPASRLLGVLADLSHRFRTILVGEDLGTVPAGFREVMDATNILAYRVLYFGQDAHGFTAAQRYPRQALACIATHDLPTMRGWWAGLDINLRERFELVSPENAARQRQNRKGERAALVRRISPGSSPVMATKPEMGPELVVEAHRFIARTPARLAVARFADLAGTIEATNVPGTSHQYPNWRIKCDLPIEALEDAPLFAQIAAAMRHERPKTRW